MATLTVTQQYQKSGASDVRAYFSDNLKFVAFAFTPSSNYAAGGDVIPAGSLPVNAANLLFNGWAVAPNCPYQFQLDVANSKLKAFIGGAEVTAAANLQTLLGTGTFLLLFATSR